MLLQQTLDSLHELRLQGMILAFEEHPSSAVHGLFLGFSPFTLL